ncbi:MAG: hypothetical protein IT162_07715, partial [Bryobacterales bacterium]|nr:hypothetical protein [Bryobacterales bacterium]
MANAIIARGFQWTDLGTADPAGCLAAEQEWLARAEARVVVWESSQECAVLGVAGRPARDVAADVAIPVLRRHSGG